MCDTDTLTFPALFVWMLTLKKNLLPCKFLCCRGGKRVEGRSTLISHFAEMALKIWAEWLLSQEGSGWLGSSALPKELCRARMHVCQMTLVCDAVPRCACHELSSLFLSLALLRGKCKFPDVFWRAMEGRKWGRESKGIYYWWQQVY